MEPTPRPLMKRCHNEDDMDTPECFSLVLLLSDDTTSDFNLHHNTCLSFGKQLAHLEDVSHPMVYGDCATTTADAAQGVSQDLADGVETSEKLVGLSCEHVTPNED